MKRVFILLVILLASAFRADCAVDDANTLSLLHFNSAISDETGRAWTAGGDAKIVASESKFGGGSLYLDGDWDWIETASSTDFAWTGPFTIDFWAEFPSIAYYTALVDTGNYATNDGIYLQIRSGNNNLSVFANSSWRISVSNTFSLNRWYHLAVVRNADTIMLFVDGQKIAAGSDTQAITSVYPFKIGREVVGSLCANMYVDEFRVSSVARWTDNFTPPTAEYAPPETIARVNFAPGGRLNLHSDLQPEGFTKSLLHFTQGAWSLDSIRGVNWSYDNSYQSWYWKFGSGSEGSWIDGFTLGQSLAADYPDGTYLKTAYDPNLIIGSSDFSIDYWAKYGAGRDTGTYVFYRQYQDASNYVKVSHECGASGYLRFVAVSGGSVIANESCQSDSTDGLWHHYEISRASGTLNFFVDGIKKTKSAVVALGTQTVPNFGSADIYALAHPIYSIEQVGWLILDEFRFQKGGGGHTADFSVETQQYNGFTAKAIDGFLTFR